MKLKLIAALSLLGAASSFGAPGIFGSSVDAFTTTSTVYKGKNFSSVPDFNGAILGFFNPSDSQIFTNAQINTSKSGGGANYSAGFTVIPEPSAAILGALGALGSLILLRKRK
ncbi:MAG: hypothetical protein IZT59_00045 [Verrucomicrobia bacterium]|nr:hypothetical protein [Verrucomicrobiota bacterium]